MKTMYLRWLEGETNDIHMLIVYNYIEKLET